MANTPQAKKRIRRNAKRAEINHSRVSRIRTFIKAVEIGDCDAARRADAAEALKKVQPEIARGVARGVIHKNTAARKISRLSKRVASARLKSRFENAMLAGRRETGGPSCFWTCQKNAAIPAIRDGR